MQDDKTPGNYKDIYNTAVNNHVPDDMLTRDRVSDDKHFVMQGLMVNDDSPIKDFYPEEFEADLNGKMQEWEAVVLIPFIDEVRMS